MVSADVLVKLPVKKRPVLALSCGSHGVPLKILWLRRVGAAGNSGPLEAVAGATDVGGVWSAVTRIYIFTREP